MYCTRSSCSHVRMSLASLGDSLGFMSDRATWDSSSSRASSPHAPSNRRHSLPAWLFLSWTRVNAQTQLHNEEIKLAKYRAPHLIKEFFLSTAYADKLFLNHWHCSASSWFKISFEKIITGGLEQRLCVGGVALLIYHNIIEIHRIRLSWWD